ncbi:Unknown protein, partial [Striga hermonthica]
RVEPRSERRAFPEEVEFLRNNQPKSIPSQSNPKPWSIPCRTASRHARALAEEAASSRAPRDPPHHTLASQRLHPRARELRRPSTSRAREFARTPTTSRALFTIPRARTRSREVESCPFLAPRALACSRPPQRDRECCPPSVSAPFVPREPATSTASSGMNGMLDLGAEINLMPYSILKQLELGDIKPTRMCSQLADRTLHYSKGVIEDILIRVGNLIVPADFVVLDVGEVPNTGNEHTIFLGRPFMATTNTLINVKDGRVTLSALGETVTFTMSEAKTTPSFTESCSYVNVIEAEVHNLFHADVSCECGVPEGEEPEKLDPKEEGVVDLIEISKEPEPREISTELKPLPPHLKYVFLEENEKKPAIIYSGLSNEEEKLLVEVLMANKDALGWILSDIKGISPATCMHRIIIEDESKPIREGQRRLNPTLMEVVKGEILKLLQEGIIYA